MRIDRLFNSLRNSCSLYSGLAFLAVMFIIVTSALAAETGTPSLNWLDMGKGLVGVDAHDPQIAMDSGGNGLVVLYQSDGSQKINWPNRRPVRSGWGSAELIESNNAGDAFRPQIAMDSGGNGLVVWYQFESFRDNIWANRYTAGSDWGSAKLIENDNTGTAYSSQIAMDNSGNGLAVWHQSDGSRYNIWVNRYTAGSGWRSSELIENDNAGHARDPQIAMDRGGNGLAVWYQSDGSRYNIWSNRYTADHGWGSAELIESDNAGSAYGPQIAMDSGGNGLAVWYQSDGSLDNIWANRYTAGSGWGGAELIENDNAGHARDPQIAMDRSGNGLAVWGQRDGSRTNIWANRYTAGNGWGSAELIEIKNGSAYSPQIAMDRGGNGLAVWEQYDGGIINIWANRYTAGRGWGSAQLIESDNAGHARDPQIAMDSGGNALAVWHQDDGSRTNIWANRYTAGRGWGSAALIESDNAGGAYEPQIAMDSVGNALAVWWQYDGSRTNIWANRYTAGRGKGSAALIESDNAGGAYEPMFTMDSGGSSLAVWSQR